jgi:tryptophanyl-tRNA synthetase
LYNADEVPVGDDQRQHIEITRDIAVRFNHRFGDTFVLPKAVHPKAGARVMDLQDPTSKMSKSATSDSGLVYLLDDNASISKKFKRAVTDSDGEVKYDVTNKPGVSNLLDILSASTGKSVEELASQYSQYGALKSDTGDAVIAVVEPIRTRFQELMQDKGELARLLSIGNERARNVAAVTLQRAHSAIGLLPRI